MPPNNNNTAKLDALLASVTDDMLPDGLSEAYANQGIRVERILLEMVYPDPVQARRVLPEQIHFKFHEGHLTPTQALRELVELVRVSARQRGRPFNNLLELLINADVGDEEQIKRTPEEETLRDLVNLAVTIRDDGQVNPLTVVDVSQGVTRLYRIETGERRYWSAWLLRDFFNEHDSDGMIDCIVIPAEKSSVFRQAKENTARKGLTAIAMARQAALLLLTVHGYEIPLHAVHNDFYRQALELRIPRGQAEAIYSAMGSITKQRFNQHKDLLRLSDEALELADRHNLDEYTLRPVLQLSKDTHAEMVQHIIQFNLSGRQVRDIIERSDEDGTNTDDEVFTAPHIKKFITSMQKMIDTSETDFVRGLLIQEHTTKVAKARIEDTIAFLIRVKNQLPDD